MHGFGHQAVLIFFVLSGYLVGGEIIRELRRGDFDWRVYAAKRLARLYAVYLAALLMGAFLDNIALRYFNRSAIYSADGQPFPMIFYSVADRLHLETFVGNLVFCQTILVPTFGSNSPLWSLANEAWYYLLFPLVAWAVLTPGRSAKRGLCLALFAAGAWFVRGDILLYFSIWLPGLVPHGIGRPLCKSPWLPAAAIVASLAVIRFPWGRAVAGFVTDLGLAGLFVLLLNSLAYRNRPGGKSPPAHRLHRFLAGFSYSLYLMHWPLALFLSVALQQTFGFGHRMTFNLVGVMVYLGFLFLIYLSAWLLAAITEHRTAWYRQCLLRLFGASPAAP